MQSVLTETEEEYEARLYATMPVPITCWYAVLKAFVCYIVRDFAAAKEAANTAIAQESGMRGQVTIPLTYTFSALARLGEAAEIPTGDENGASEDTDTRRQHLITQAGALLGGGGRGECVASPRLPRVLTLLQTRTTSNCERGWPSPR